MSLAYPEMASFVQYSGFPNPIYYCFLVPIFFRRMPSCRVFFHSVMTAELITLRGASSRLTFSWIAAVGG